MKRKLALQKLSLAIALYDSLQEGYNVAEQLYMEVHKPLVDNVPLEERVRRKSPTQWHTITDHINDALAEVGDEIVNLAREATKQRSQHDNP